MKRLMTAVLAVAVGSAGALAAPTPKDKPKEGEGPIAAKIVLKKHTYKLDLEGMTADKYAEAIKDGEKTGKLPKVPEIDLVLELTNTGDKDVKMWNTGDPVVLMLDLKGPGAMSVAPLRPMTLEFRVPEAVTLAPGKSLSVPIKSLTYGMRGNSNQAYWTKSGEYTLGATYQTGISPPPAGAKDVEEGFARLKVTADPVKITVEEAK
jgi:hypothetical protein